MKVKTLTKRFISLILSMIMIFSFCGYFPMKKIVAEAATSVSPGIYIIEFRSGKVLDVTDESINNGTQLQIWQRYEDHSNQKFKIEKSGSYWKITAMNSNKVIEVRDSSKQDYAQVAQWSDSNIACQRWEIESDGSFVRFKNANSGMYMTVFNAYSSIANGSKIVQRPKLTGDNKIEQQFKLLKLDGVEIVSAIWERQLNVDDIKWDKYSRFSFNPLTYRNQTGIYFPDKPDGQYGTWDWDKVYVPSTDNCILVRVEYIDREKAKKMIVDKAKEFEDSATTCKKYVEGQIQDFVISETMNRIFEFAGVPFVGDITVFLKGFCELSISAQSNHQNWCDFCDVWSDNEQQGCGVIKKTYLKFSPSSTFGGEPCIAAYTEYTSEKWDGKSINYNLPYDGKWAYQLANYSTDITVSSLVIHTYNSPNYVYTVNNNINSNPSNYVTSNPSYSNGMYQITASSLNVRSGPGSGYEPPIGGLSYGQEVEVVAVSSGCWGKINYNKKTGWISLKYAKYKGDSSGSSGGTSGSQSWDNSSSGDYCVNVNSHLMIRQRATTNSEIIRRLNNGEIVHVIETTYGKDGRLWAHINYNGTNGYCCMKDTNGAYYLSQRISPSKPYVNATGGTSQSDSYFSWNNCSNANRYDIRIYNSSGQLVDSKFGLTSTSYQTRLKAGNYQVDVASVYSSESYTFSDRVNFTVNKVTPDKPVVNVVPGNDLSDTCISWNNCRYADCYDVNIYKSNGTRYKTITNTTATSFKGNLSDIADYYIIVTAKNQTDGTSSSSDKKSFTVVSAVPSKPTLSLIAGNNHTNTVFTWNVCENANTYTLDVTNTDTGQKVLSKSLLTVTNYEAMLSVPGNYSAQVTSVYTKGGTTNKSDVVKFYVEDVDVKPFSISVAGVSDTIVSLAWKESLHATKYDVYRYSEGKYSLIGTTSELSYVDTGLYVGTEYKYYVHASNEWTDIKSDNEVTAETILLYLNGSGSEESPYIISSEDDWMMFTDLINNPKTNKMFASSYYKQTVDINFESAITPVGTKETPFNGFYNGNYCTITGLSISTKSDNLGLFGYCKDANISNLSVHGSISSTYSNVGGIAGTIGLGGKIENCSFSGDVKGTTNVGGIVGYIENGGSLIRCYHTGSVSGDVSGGIVGKARVGWYSNSTDINVSQCYHSGGNVSGTYSGGVTGYEEIGSIKKCSINYSECFYLKGTASNPISGKTNADIHVATDAVFQSLAVSLGEPYTDGGTSNNHYPVFKWEADLYQFKGQGTSSSPYLIETPEDLKTLSKYVNDQYLNTKYGNACYLQISDIDLANVSFESIGNEKFPFNSSYNGGYHSISGLNTSGDNAGLFGYVENARISNLVVNGKVTGSNSAGGIVGYSSESIEINQCAFNGDINSKIAGGLVGKANYMASITSGYHNGNVTGGISGGLVGQFDNGENEATNSLSLVSCYHGSGSVGNGAIGSLLSNEISIYSENVYCLKSSSSSSGCAQIVNETVLKNLAVTLEKPFSHGNINNGYPVFEWQIEKYTFEGNGTSDSPYIIATPDDLIALQRYVNDPSYNAIYGSAYYQQANDIDLGDREWEAIGINAQCSFNGIYDGNFCTIYGLNAYGDTYSGLFGQVGTTSGTRKAGIYNLVIKYGSSCSSTGVTGGTAAVLMNGATVDSCCVIGDLSGGEGVGGLVGIVRRSASVFNSYHNGSVTGQRYVGGLVGYVESGTLRIENCYHTSGVIYADQKYGAIVGYSKGTSNISNCYYLEGSCDYGNLGAVSVNSMVLQNLSITLGDAYIDNFTEYNDGYPIFAAQYDIDKPFVSGDVNSDGYFDIEDIKMLQSWLLGSGCLTDWEAGDLCEDGIIDVFDLTLMKRMYMS